MPASRSAWVTTCWAEHRIEPYGARLSVGQSTVSLSSATVIGLVSVTLPLLLMTYE